MAQVKLVNVCKSYGKVDISKDINLHINDGELVVFVGPSGCGKSTLLRMIAGLEDITSGDLLIDGKRMNDIEPSKRSIGMVFQSYALYPHLTVADNMSFGMKLAREDKAKISQRVEEVAEILQLTPLLSRKPKELSGGQRQRVAIGRTLVSRPDIFLLDEPLSNLDAALRVNMRAEIAKLHKKLDKTMIYVTHDQVEAMTLANKIVVLDAGIVAQVGKPLEVYHYPANKFVAGFIGSPKMNFISAKAVEVSDKGVKISLPNTDSVDFWVPVDSQGVSVGDTMTLGIRPEHLLPADESNCHLTGKITVLEKLGYETQAHLHISSQEQDIIYRQDDTLLAEVDDKLILGINPDRCHLFKSDDTACRRLFKEQGV